MKKKLLLLTGRARHGKDSLAQVIRDEFGYFPIALGDAVKQFALAVDPIVEVPGPVNFVGAPLGAKYLRLKTIIDQIGWEDGKKIPEVRRLLQAIGTEGARNIIDDEIWLKLGEVISNRHEKSVFTDIRFPNEVYFLKCRGCIAIRVTRPNFDSGVDITHGSEKYIPQLDVDYDIVNDQGLPELRAKIKELMINEIEPRMYVD